MPFEQLTRESLEQSLLPAVMAVEGLMPLVSVSDAQLGRLKNGLSIPSAATPPCAAVDQHGELVAILERRADETLGPTKFFDCR